MPESCKVLTVLGARPQFVKAAAVSRALKKNGHFTEIFVHTGQHFDRQMSDVFFDQLDLPQIKYNLGIDSLSHGAMTGRMLEEIEKIIIEENPDYVMIYGDTNSTLAGALAGKKLAKKIIHVEAGLRSFDDTMPEEINRILTDRISDILFCPTENAVKNLHDEGFKKFPVKIINSGDVMFDTYIYFREKVKSEKLNLPRDFILCTIHRAENTDNQERLKTILEALEVINTDAKIILPLHPRTRKIIKDLNIESTLEFVEPVGYLEMIGLLENCRMVITDSGGLQKEAYFAKKFCLTLRDTTEWTELVDAGLNRLVPVEKTAILNQYKNHLEGAADFSLNFYGSGSAADIIASEIWKDFSGNDF